MKYIKYLSYVLRHKWFVLLQCLSNGQFWLGIIHDWSKFLPSEFFPYARHFYGKKSAEKNCYECNHIAGNQCRFNYSGIGDGEQASNCIDYSIANHPPRDETGYYKPTDTGDAAFDFAWLLHQKRNRHHWQWWILPEDESGIKILEMPYKYRNEMICDWKGASRAQGHNGEIITWWEANNQKLQLHRNTRHIIEHYIIQLGKLLST